jgi:hypothetical protein
VIDPGILAQTVAPATDRIQVVEWDLDQGVLDIEGALVDLLVGEPCSFTDTVRLFPVTDDPCGSGIVIESSPSPLGVELLLTVTEMRVRREEPLDDLPPMTDYDLDGAPNGVDNCPLVNNPDQRDDDADGVGNACTVVDFFLGNVPDSDADGVADSSDNCVWVSNADQSDDGGVGALGDDPRPDNGIGDLCREQLAPVEPFTLNLPPATLLQAFGGTTYITVDFENQETLRCDWTLARCTLDAARVELCTHESFSDALDGC